MKSITLRRNPNKTETIYLDESAVTWGDLLDKIPENYGEAKLFKSKTTADDLPGNPQLKLDRSTLIQDVGFDFEIEAERACDNQQVIRSFRNNQKIIVGGRPMELVRGENHRITLDNERFRPDLKILWVVFEVIEENRRYKCRQYHIDGSGEIEIGSPSDTNDYSLRLKTDDGYSILMSSPIQDIDTRGTSQRIKDFLVDLVLGVARPLVEVGVRTVIREFIPEALNSASDALSSALENYASNSISEASNNQNGTVETTVQPRN